jgi:hypothetical protein
MVKLSEISWEIMWVWLEWTYWSEKAPHLDFVICNLNETNNVIQI